MNTRSRMIEGVGRASDATDGDVVIVQLGIRDGKIAYIGADGIRTGITTWPIGGVSTTIEFKTGLQAREHGETFVGCETARTAALALHRVFIGREIEESLRIAVSEIAAKMDPPPEKERCVRTVLMAVRRALIDVQVTVLARAIVETRTLSEAT